MSVSRSDLRERAERLRALHRSPPILVLPNAWDAASATAFGGIDGCRAIATTSSAIAAGHGYPDGEHIPPDEMLAAVAQIVRAVDLPVTADLEAGYGDPAGTAEAAIEAGAVGLNLEDNLGPVAEHVARIQAVRETGERLGVPLVINARTDVFLRGSRDPEEAASRANAYLEAGADCAFVIWVEDAETIGRLAAAIHGPLNVLARRGTPPVAELERLGVARVSVGSGLAHAALAAAKEGARELLDHGTYGFAV
jgi:2-methylisocitrate lyase-like PEP mutase family enzyme